MGKLIDEALHLAARDAVQQHLAAGLPLAVSENGKVVWVSPQEAEAKINPKKPRSRRSRKG